MKNGQCTKCGSNEVYRGQSSDGEGLSAGSYLLLVEIASGNKQAVLGLDTYICRACGYVELFIPFSAALNMLPETDGWVKVNDVNEQA